MTCAVVDEPLLKHDNLAESANQVLDGSLLELQRERGREGERERERRE